MKVLQINSVCGVKSTGRILTDLYHTLKKEGHDCVVAYGREKPLNINIQDTIKIGNTFDVMFHVLMSRITDKNGFYSKSATRKLIKKIKEYSPDIIHLHNIHGYYINVEILFEYLAKANLPVVWTMHDCWAFTGHCTYFEYAKCDKWKKNCFNCIQKREYPSSFIIDNSKENFEKKCNIFTSVKKLEIITPSEWLANLLKESFLSDVKIGVINNGIDLNSFKPIENDFKKRYQIENKKIILGVAGVWNKRKGFETFIELAEKVDDDVAIVMVGVSKKQLKMLPDNIIGIVRTDSVEELAKIYSSADLFINPTLEDNFPTTNLEAMACGTPVVTYNTGGSPESISDECGKVVEKGDIEAIVECISNLNFLKENIIEHSKKFDRNYKYKEYIELYMRSLK